MATVEELNAQAAQVALKYTPLRVLRMVVYGAFALIGWAIGRVWLGIMHVFVFVVLAVQEGYRHGTKFKGTTPPEQPEQPHYQQVPGMTSGVGFAEPGV